MTEAAPEDGGTVTAVVTRLIPSDLAQRETLTVVRQVWPATRAFTADPAFPWEAYSTYKKCANQNIVLKMGLATTVRPRVVAPAVTTVVPPSLYRAWACSGRCPSRRPRPPTRRRHRPRQISLGGPIMACLPQETVHV